MRSLTTLLLALLSIGASASAATITLENCASCQGSTVSLSVDPAGGGNWDVTLTLDTTNYDGSPDGVVQAGFKAISGITNSDISLTASPDASWSDPKLAGISANGLCTGAGEADFVCTAGYTDVTANPAIYTWGFTVEGGALLTEWSIKFQYCDSGDESCRGNIISEPGILVPEPSAALVFAVGLLIAASHRRR